MATELFYQPVLEDDDNEAHTHTHTVQSTIHSETYHFGIHNQPHRTQCTCKSHQKNQISNELECWAFTKINDVRYKINNHT